MTTFGLLIFGEAEELDFCGPWEVFTASSMLRDIPDEVLLILSVRFAPQLSAEAVAGAIDGIQQAIRAEYPEMKRIYVEAEPQGASPGTGG